MGLFTFSARILAGVLALMVGATLHAKNLGVKNPRDYLIDRDEEIALSRSAGPASVANDATVLVLTQDGEYETAVEGTNGWVCFTGRGWTGPASVVDGRRVWTEDHFDSDVLAPQCFNPLGAESILPMHFLATRLLMNGKGVEETEAAIAFALQAGELTAPATGAMSYMLSPKQFLNQAVGRFMPHLMLYTAYAPKDNYGGRDEHVPTLPVVTEPGTAWAVTIILSPVWSNGEPAKMGH